MTLIELMLVNGSIRHYKVRRRFWFFAALAVILLGRVVASIPIPDHLVTSIYWQGMIYGG
jgi:hypothetical protein